MHILETIEKHRYNLEYCKYTNTKQICKETEIKISQLK